MKREEAIRELREDKALYETEICHAGDGTPDGDLLEALDMAIESLQREEAEEKGWCHRIRPKNVEVVVRCKDCKWYISHYDNCGKCTYRMREFLYCREDDFCSYGERKE